MQDNTNLSTYEARKLYDAALSVVRDIMDGTLRPDGEMLFKKDGCPCCAMGHVAYRAAPSETTGGRRSLLDRVKWALGSDAYDMVTARNDRAAKFERQHSGEKGKWQDLEREHRWTMTCQALDVYAERLRLHWHLDEVLE